MVLIIASIVCCITVIAIGKRRKRQNVISSNTQQFELQNIGSLESTETITQKGSSLPPPLPKVPNTTLNTIPQRQNQNSVYVTQPVHFPVPNRRPLLPYNESSNNVGSHEAQFPVPSPHLAPYQQQQPAPYPWQARSNVQATFNNPACEFLDDAHEESDCYNMEEHYEEIKPLKTPPPPNCTDLFKK